MAKIKSNLCGFILTIASVLTGILAFVSLAFKVFAKTTTTIVSQSPMLAGTKTTTNSLKNWLNNINEYSKAGIDGANLLKVAKVFLIITLVLVAIAVVLAVVKFFINNKYVDIALAIVGGLVVACVIVTLVTLLVGSNKVTAESVKLTTASVKAYDPTATVTAKTTAGAIPICLLVFSAINGIVALVMSVLSLAKKAK